MSKDSQGNRPRYHNPHFGSIKLNVLQSYFHLCKAEGLEGQEIVDNMIADLEMITEEALRANNMPERKRAR